MTENFSLAALGSTVLAEGVKFFYSQAAEALKRWRERAGEPGSHPRVQSAPTLPPIFKAHPAALAFHLDKLEALEQPLSQLLGSLGDYVNGRKPVDAGDRGLVASVEALRQALEQIHQQSLTFKHEQRSDAPSAASLVVPTLLQAAVALAPGGPARSADVTADAPADLPSLLGIRIGVGR